VLKPEKPKNRDFAEWPPNVVPDGATWVFWLPEGWGQGWKTTSGGKQLKCYIKPGGKLYYHKADIEKALGVKLASKEVVDDVVGPNANVETAVPSWPGLEWLPKDWRIAFRQLPSRLHRIYIPPDQEEGFCYHRSDVERYLAGERGKLSAIGSSKPMAQICEIVAARIGEAPSAFSVVSPSKSGRSPGGDRRPKRPRLDSGPCAVDQIGWAACSQQAEAQLALSRFRPLLEARGFSFGGSSAGLQAQGVVPNSALVALYGLRGDHRYASRVNGVYVEMAALPGEPPYYQKVIFAAGSVEGLGCDGVYIVWDVARGQWCVASQPTDEAPRFAYCEGLEEVPSFAEQARLPEVLTSSWEVTTDDLGLTFEAEPSLTVLGDGTGGEA